MPRENCRKVSKNFLTIFDVFRPARKKPKSVEKLFDAFLTFFDVAPFRWPLLRSADICEDLLETASFPESKTSPPKPLVCAPLCCESLFTQMVEVSCGQRIQTKIAGATKHMLVWGHNLTQLGAGAPAASRTRKPGIKRVKWTPDPDTFEKYRDTPPVSFAILWQKYALLLLGRK